MGKFWKKALSIGTLGMSDIAGKALGGGGSGGGGKKEARKAVSTQQEALEFAKAQFELFAPALREIGGFFSKAPLEDVVSGKIVSQVAKTRVANLNRGYATAKAGLSREIARRGISNDAPGLAMLSNLDATRGAAVENVMAEEIDKDIGRRTQFASLGVPMAGNVQTGYGNLSNAILNLGSLKERERNQKLEMIGKVLGTAGAVAGTMGGGAGGFPGMSSAPSSAGVTSGIQYNAFQGYPTG